MKKLFITLTLLTLFNTQNCSNNKKKRDEILNKLANKTHPEKAMHEKLPGLHKKLSRDDRVHLLKKTSSK